MSLFGGDDKAATETLIFVDVDGVLNVGVGDPGHAPLEFSTSNVERAEAKRSSRRSCDPSQRLCIERIVATYGRVVGHGEDDTYRKLISSPSTNLSDVLVGRLAQIIRASGRNAQVVLSSTWRWPKHAQRVRKLEEAVGRHLGKHFEFDARTPLWEDRSAEARLQCIGEFAAAYCEKRRSSAGKLRMMMLEDFHLTAFGTWSCDGHGMHSAEAVERYLLSCIPDNVAATAKLIHTFDEWTEPNGLAVRIGCGLTKGNLNKALAFLGVPIEQVSLPSPPPTKNAPGVSPLLRRVSDGSTATGPGSKVRPPSRGTAATSRSTSARGAGRSGGFGLPALRPVLAS